jgi:hypothetical protein
VLPDVRVAGAVPAALHDRPRRGRRRLVRACRASLGGWVFKIFLGDASASLVTDAQSSLGDAQSSLVDVKSSLGDAESSLGDAKSLLGDVKSSLGDG